MSLQNTNAEVEIIGKTIREDDEELYDQIFHLPFIIQSLCL